jgi:hypothetical protein
MKHLVGFAWRLILITFLGFLGGLIAGLMVYGSEIFIPQSVGFAYYVIYGLSTSFIFAFYHMRGLSPTIVAALFASLLIFLIATLWMPVINSAIWSFGINMAVVVVAFLFEQKLAYFKQWKFTVMGVIYAATFVVITLLVGIITKVEAMPPVMFQQNFLDGLRLGLGLGIGVEIAESIIHSIEAHRKARK